MNLLKLTTAALLLTTTFPLLAEVLPVEFPKDEFKEPTIFHRDGSRKVFVSISVKDNGEILGVSKSESGKSINNIFKPNDVLCAFVPKKLTPEIVEAEKDFTARKYADANKKFQDAYAKYGKIGWDALTLLRSAQCQIELDQKADAIATLEKLTAIKVDKLTAFKTEFIDYGWIHIGPLYVKNGNTDKAAQVAKTMISSNNPFVQSAACETEGDIAYQQGKKRDAALNYLQAALVYDDKAPSRPKALFMAAKCFKELSDSRGVRFGEWLKRDYPNSEYVSQLK